MTAKEYLEQAYSLDQRINSKLEQALTLRALTQKITVSYEGEPVSHTRNNSSMENAIIRLLEAETELNSSIDALIDLKREMAQCINALENGNYQLLLEKRYLCFQPWSKIAEDLSFSARWLHVVHTRALEAIDKILREKHILS